MTSGGTQARKAAFKVLLLEYRVPSQYDHITLGSIAWFDRYLIVSNDRGLTGRSRLQTSISQVSVTPSLQLQLHELVHRPGLESWTNYIIYVTAIPN